MRTYVWSILALLALADVRPEHGPAPDAPSTVRCQVTSPNGVPAVGEQPSPFIHGNNALSVVLDWPDGTVTFKPGGPGFVLADGSLSMKFPWRRGVPGQLAIVGYRLDAIAPPLQASIPSGYGNIGFQATSLVFPGPGCWKVTGMVGTASLTFVIRVVRIGDGPRRVE